MDENKRYYWIKLKTNFFDREDIDFMMSQENGCEYVVLYQMLCLNTANNDGRLETKMNEVIVPYDIKKIVRDCKYFDYDTVAVALELYKKLGLIYETEDRVLKLTGQGYMIGSESASREAIKKREYRQRLKEKDNEKTIEGTKCPTEYRYKSIEYRDIDNRYKNIKNSVGVGVEELNEFFERFEVDEEHQNILMDYLEAGMTLEVIKEGLLLPYSRNVMNFDFETEELPIKDNEAYGYTVLENWFNFGVRTMNDKKKYCKLNRNRTEMLGAEKYEEN